MKIDSIDVAKMSIKLAITPSRDEEDRLIANLKDQGYKAAAVDVGGNLLQSIPKIIERTVVAARRTGVTKECHAHDGAIIGATREAIMQVRSKATGFNVGGKIGIARYGDHLSICIFMSIGLLHLNEVVIGLGHRVISDYKD